MKYDKVIFGAGFYGLYAACSCGRKNQKILILEKESQPFLRASYINQARVHMGYHYPRSMTTAVRSAEYFERFSEEFKFCINSEFKQIYATAKRFSWTTSQEFKKFCQRSGIPCEEVDVDKYFKKGMCDGAFLTTEYTYDAKLLREQLMSQVEELPNVDILFAHKPDKIEQIGTHWHIETGNYKVETPFILNTTYAGMNEIHSLMNFKPFRIKYEKCEIILCKAGEKLHNIGITVMDGPFFSIMPFGKTGFHSLTSVSFTPHETSYEDVVDFECQKESMGECSRGNLNNCNFCKYKPKTAWDYMSQLAKTYLIDSYNFDYDNSMFVIKPILQSSEVDDSRPTVVKEMNKEPRFISVLSGKINTVYDLEEVLS